MSWPNRITVLRLLMVPVFVLLLLNAAGNPAYRYAAMGLAVIIGICDAADGIIARRTGSVTRIGSILDPLADKALMISALVTMSIEGVLSSRYPDLGVPTWAAVALVSRDLFILLGTVIVFLLVGMFQAMPSLTGKAATVMQFVSILFTLATPDLVAGAPDLTWWSLRILWGVTVALGLVSWLGYIRTGSKLLAAGAE